MPLLISVDIKKKQKKKRKKKEKKRKRQSGIYLPDPGPCRGQSDLVFLGKLHTCGSPFYPAMAQSQCPMATGRNSGLSLCHSWMFVQIYVCIYIYIHIYIYIYIYIYIHIYIHIYIYCIIKHIDTICIYIYAVLYLCTHYLSIYIYLDSQIHTNVYMERLIYRPLISNIRLHIMTYITYPLVN